MGVFCVAGVPVVYITLVNTVYVRIASDNWASDFWASTKELVHLSQLKKGTQAAEQPISFQYFRSRDIFPRWLATVCWREQEISTKTRAKHDILLENVLYLGLWWASKQKI